MRGCENAKLGKVITWENGKMENERMIMRRQRNGKTRKGENEEDGRIGKWEGKTMEKDKVDMIERWKKGNAKMGSGKI